jgi:hypothetical protein
VQEKVAWLGLFLSSITPHSGHPLLVYCGVDKQYASSAYREAGSAGFVGHERLQLSERPVTKPSAFGAAYSPRDEIAIRHNDPAIRIEWGMENPKLDAQAQILGLCRDFHLQAVDHARHT